ncbi:MAG: TetR/AcrR family transcriptional regulator [Herbiconiux sp.]|nr:TetR/AcrR family transcriptional regulator [Herbiconiux sp.]
MTTRIEQRAATREKILAAAASEFAAHGFTATTFSSIAAAMGKPKSALAYSQFRSKEEIAIAVIDRQRETWTVFFERASGVEPAGLPRLLSLLMTAAVDARMNDSGRAAVRLIIEGRQHGDLQVSPTFGWREHIAAEMKTAVQLGQLPAETDIVSAARQIVTSAYGLFEAENKGLQPSDTERGLRLVWTNLLVGLGAHDAAGILKATAVLTA